MVIIARFPEQEEAARAAAVGVLNEAIKVAGIGKAELARRMGTPLPNVLRILGPDSNPTARTIGRVLAACGLRPAFGYDVPRRTP